MRVRLFWQLLGGFAILIVFGIGGTTALISAAFKQITTRNAETAAVSMENAWAPQLADYYVAHGHSWEGVDDRLQSMIGPQHWGFGTADGYVLWDSQDNPIAESKGAMVEKGRLALPTPDAGIPIVVEGAEVGKFALVSSGFPFAPAVPFAPARGMTPPAVADVPPSTTMVQRQIGRAFGLVALSIGSVTLSLAVILSRRISAPLAAMTGAARRIAGGDLQRESSGIVDSGS